jgi:hypothetical protein
MKTELVSETVYLSNQHGCRPQMLLKNPSTPRHRMCEAQIFRKKVDLIFHASAILPSLLFMIHALMNNFTTVIKTLFQVANNYYDTHYYNNNSVQFNLSHHLAKFKKANLRQ